MHRIMPKNPTQIAPVITFHGMLGSSGDMVMSGNYSPGFYLVDKGFDLWLGNARGNRFNTRHKTLTMKDAKFWDFSFHEMGIYDLPAMVDYTLKITQKKRAFFIGHSQGNISLYYSIIILI
jgi:pimeloyl-ACP methyl ester carboxylesterase